MTWFDSFREAPSNTYYGDRRSAAVIDFGHVMLAFFTAVLCIVIIVLVIGSRGREKWLTLLRLFLGLHAGVAILVCVTGQYWQVSSVYTRCDYSAMTGRTLGQQGIKADIGVRVGLKAVNITLAGPVNNTKQIGMIRYNEEFGFVGVTEIEDAMTSALRRGLPHPVLYVLEYFGADVGGLRWSRAFREAGHFAFILLWASLASWLLSNVILCFDVIRGAFLTMLTGTMMVTSCILYGSLQPKVPLIIPVQDGHLQLHYGWCFWLCVISGVVTLVTGGVAILVHTRCPSWTSELFLSDACDVQADDDTSDGVTSYVHGPLEIETPYFVRKKNREQMSPYTFDNIVYEDGPSDADGGAILMQPPPYTAHGQTETETKDDVSSTDDDIMAATADFTSGSSSDDDAVSASRQRAPQHCQPRDHEPEHFRTVVTIENDSTVLGEIESTF